jgi:GT2 family glycosyltransferase
MNPKILVGIPVYDGMAYCINDVLDNLRNLEYDNYDLLVIDNSKTNDFFERLKKEKKIILIKDNTNEEKNKLRLISSRNKILDYALEKDYAYVLMMDADVIPPKNIIKKLLDNDKDIISGIYYNYFTIDGKQKYRPVVWCHISQEEFEKIKKQTNFPASITHEKLRRHLTQKEAESGKLIKVKLPSAGCMLIKKKVFEKIKYGLLDIPKNLSTGDDIYFCKKAEEAGFEIYCNTNIKCKHLTFGKLYSDKEGNLRNPLHD